MITMNNAMLARFTSGIVNANGANGTIDIYSGAILNITNTSSWSPTPYASQLLARFTGVGVGQIVGIGGIRAPTVNPTAATSTGTATWFAWYQTTYCIIGLITDAGPNIAPMYIGSTNVVTGNFVNLIQLSIKVSFI